MEEKIKDSVLATTKLEDDEELNLRPQKLNEYVGQSALKENLDVFIKAAKSRDEALDHCLFYGPPGLGKQHWHIFWLMK